MHTNTNVKRRKSALTGPRGDVSHEVKPIDYPQVKNSFNSRSYV